MSRIIPQYQSKQERMFYKADRQIAEANLFFFELVKDGLTKDELKDLIKHYPSRWSRFKGWLTKLP